jgi:hypothetical protein
MALNEVRSLITSKMTLSHQVLKVKSSIPRLRKSMPLRLSLNATTSSLLSGPKPTSMLLFGIVKPFAKSEILQRSITKAIKKSCHHDANLSYLNQPAINKRHQFVGFVSSHTSDNSISGFCLNSFAVFHCDVNGNTIITCLVTARHHILSNMQDRLLQLI